jgi:hypothetical protein
MDKASLDHVRAILLQSVNAIVEFSQCASPVLTFEVKIVFECVNINSTFMVFKVKYAEIYACIMDESLQGILTTGLDYIIRLSRFPANN